MLSAGAADALGNDLASLGDEIPERLRIFVVDDETLVGAETANPPPTAPPPRRVTATVVISISLRAAAVMGT